MWKEMVRQKQWLTSHDLELSIMASALKSYKVTSLTRVDKPKGVRWGHLF